MQTTTTPKIELRAYQKQMVAETYQAVRDKQNRILLIALMGLGKSYTCAWILRDAINAGKRCIFLVPLTSLVDQMLGSLADLGIHATALQGDRVVDSSAPCIVASVQTIDSRIRRGQSFEDLLGPVDLVVADEAHVTSFTGQFDDLADWVLSRGGLSIGLTATPWRLKAKKEWLGQKYDHTVVGPQPPEAIRLGAVVPVRAFSVRKVFDFETLKRSGSSGDYSDKSLANQATRPEALAHVVKEWHRLAEGRPTIMIGAAVHQAMMTATEFEKSGVSTACIFGDTSLAERERIFEQVKSGAVNMICSVGCLTAGVDLKFISCILYVRATKSKSLFFQTAGRGCRTYEGKHDFILLDFGENLKRHRSPMAFQDYDISQKPVKDWPESTKPCFNCGAEIPIFAEFCPECGADCRGDGSDDVSDPDLRFLSEYLDIEAKDKLKFLRRKRREAWLERTAPDSPINDFVAKYGHIPSTVWVHRTFLHRRKISQTQLDKFLTWLEESYTGKPQWEQQWMSYHLSLEFGTDDLGTIALPEWHEVLGLKATASYDDALQAYRQKMMLNPDRQTAADLNDAFGECRNENA